MAGAWLALAGAAFAEPGAPPGSPPVLGDGTPVPPPVEARRIRPTRTSPAPDRPSLFEAVRLQLPSWRSLGGGDYLSQVSFQHENTIPGAVVIDYDGLQGYVVKQIRKKMSSEWRRNLKAQARYEHDPFAPTLRDRMEAMAFAMDDFERGGRWWDRTWYDSLPARRGGAPERAFQHQVGTRVNVIELGPLSLTNDLRGRVADIALFQLDPGFVYRDLDSDEPVKARDYARLDRSGVSVHDDSDDLGPEDLPGRVRPQRGPGALVISSDDALGFTISPRANGRLLDGYHCRLKLRPRGRFSLSSMQPEAEASLKVTFELLMGSKGNTFKVAELEAELEYDPFDGEVEAELEFALLTW